MSEALMQGGLTVELFDILTYVLPGLIALAALRMLCQRNSSCSITLPREHSIVYALLASFFVGVIAHIAASAATFLVFAVFGHRVLEDTVARFPDLQAVKDHTQRILHVHTTDIGRVYRFSEDYVMERGGRQGASVSRLLALSLFCRNSILPVLGFGVAYLRSTETSKRNSALTAAVTFTVCVALLAGYSNYYIAAINKVLRTFLVLVSLQQ